jgi:prepilin-type N-terminal cleavage/methylation domain-containing protein
MAAWNDRSSGVGRGARVSRSARGFTLVELMVASGLALVLLAAVMSTFLFLVRGGLRMAFYRDMEAQSRLVMQQFGTDARQATQVFWNNANSLTLTVEGAAVTYAYDSSAHTLLRQGAGRPAQVVASGVAAFEFKAYDYNSSALSLRAPTAQTNAATKIVQLDIDMSRSASRISATNQIISTRYMLRGKGGA